MTLNLSCGKCKAIRSFSGMPPTCDVCGWVCSTTTAFSPASDLPKSQTESKSTASPMPFWNIPEINRLRKFVGGAFLLWLAALCADYYVHSSGWYPRQREVAVFFNPHEWIDGEIKTCYPLKESQEAELFGIDCSDDRIRNAQGDRYFHYSPESHVLKVKFWGSLKADTSKPWKCEWSQMTMTCRLQ